MQGMGYRRDGVNVDSFRGKDGTDMLSRNVGQLQAYVA